MPHVLLLGNAEGTGPFTVQEATAFRGARLAQLVADDTTDASDAIQAALDALDRTVGGVVEIPPGKYYVGKTIEIPHITSTDQSRIVIRGYGARLRTDKAIPVLRRIPANQPEAEGMVTVAVVIEGLEVMGTPGVVGQIGLLLGATLNSRIVGCHFTTLETGLELQFCLNARVESCRTTSNRKYGFRARSGTWTGATLNNSQCNHTSFVQCRSNEATDAAAAGTLLAQFHIHGSSGVCLDSCIVEGGGPVNNVVFDWGGDDPGAAARFAGRTFFIRNLHIENHPTGAHVKITSGSMVDLDGLFFTSDKVLVEWTTQTHHTTVRNVPWRTIDHDALSPPFKVPGTGGKFSFVNVGDSSVDWTNTVRWIDGVKPTNLTIA